MEQLARLPGLRHGMERVESGHVLVRDLGIDPHHLGMIEGGDEAEIRSGGRHVDVAARLVGLGFHRELEAVLLVEVVLAKIIDGLAQALDRVIRTPARVGFRSLAASPQHEDLRAQLRAEVHRGHRLLHGIGAHRGSLAVNAPSRNTGS